MIIGMHQGSEVGVLIEMVPCHPLQIHGQHHVAIQDKKVLGQQVERSKQGSGRA